ncbi:hypothetical protein G647_01627 [Cladophialophora carrionii CBS 160.54]|uniref:Ubiquitin-like-conjugating enzyme ATG10 n=1 Tax=Cladophialophora carrionii CBS 160.54 TaxID=1279043 RepID=V9DQI5_9EURO|nr:uncharacterized protein G647_01627 [Cladophialophora carrionii CBS 160.54]ETI29174.1 hypothetical protein G647_01627 [Cladophialophora carrionii CBS 160.54]
MRSLEAFPAITKDEFCKACKALERRSADSISDTDWLSVRWSGEELLIRQRRNTLLHSGSRRLASDQGTNTGEVGGKEDFENIVEDEVEDSSIKDTDTCLIVDFSVILSPTYCVPVLWFSCHHGPEKRPITLDQIYEQLVPQPSSAPLRGVGVLGGISMAHHPVSDLPSFFLHPCNTQDALSVLKPDHDPTPDEYLILWLGLIGSAVGLHIPSKLLSS